jgi:hypothetical protein
MSELNGRGFDRVHKANSAKGRNRNPQNETEQPDHFASFGDSVASSTRMTFSTHSQF